MDFHRWTARFPRTLALFVILLCGTLESTEGTFRSRRSPSDSSRPNVYRDDNRPIFTDCATYNLRMKEEQPRFTFVTKVHADDPDPEDAGGRITYSFITSDGDTRKFEINNVTGVIRTTQILDRDEPEYFKETYLTVLAVDNSLQQLADYCTFKITIEDINDNEPMFDRVSYTESVPQDLPINDEVMRVSATDFDDGDNSVVKYSLKATRPEYQNYFTIHENTGKIYLNKTLTHLDPGYIFHLIAIAQDSGNPPLQGEVKLEIRVVESHKKAPTFVSRFPDNKTIYLPENFNDFNKAIVQLEAVSNIDAHPDCTFELLPGRTEQANNFLLESKNNSAIIKLSRALDYERCTEYTLHVRVKNNYDLAAETIVNIQVEDVNDEIPHFHKLQKGSVLENEPPGVTVMQVSAIDRDGTSAHNQVTYELGNYNDLFAIDKHTGLITTRTTFDREKVDFYNVKVIAWDNSPSVYFHTGEHNHGEQSFQIIIADKNDNPPRFTQATYITKSIFENANINSFVTEVRAIDSDIASVIEYSIIAGNINNSFIIQDTDTGVIRTNAKLDYEKITNYSLIVRAFDGIFDDNATVRIFVEDVNDNTPVFEPFYSNPVIDEETLIDGCITTVTAYDPDIPDRNADQHIIYTIVKDVQRKFLDIDKYGCIRLKKALDRDKPNGFPVWTVIVMARDHDGSDDFLDQYATINITLRDINDNAPILNVPQPVVWYENEEPGVIIKLEAKDYDSSENGPPFNFSIDMNTVEDEIMDKFRIVADNLYALVTFDREERKQYNIPIAISDNGRPTMTGTSMLTVIIGDKNDTPMKEGSSSIFVYNYEGIAPETDIGRVYVDDPDDWDLADKHFSWAAGKPHDFFTLDPATGMIRMQAKISSSGSYLLKFNVKEESKVFETHTVPATVNVTIKLIPREAVVKSGSIRFYGITAEEFVAAPNNPQQQQQQMSKQSVLQKYLAMMLNTSTDNVDVFTVLHSPYHGRNESMLDVRFSAHGSPYYAAEALNTIIAQNSKEIEYQLDAHIMMVNIDECVYENLHCKDMCQSHLNISNVPYAVFTNRSSFVGVRATVEPQCTCHSVDPIVMCLNGGTLMGKRCVCPEGLKGPRCELLNMGFGGDGWAIMPAPGQVCDDSHLGLKLTLFADNGLVFYIGPMSYSERLGVQDFMALEVHNGYAILYIDYGTGTIKLEQNKIKLNDGKEHSIDIFWTKTVVEIKIDDCGRSCMNLTAPRGPNEFLNVYSPLQIGGSLTNLMEMSSSHGWNYTPTSQGLNGCISNVTLNGKTQDFAAPPVAKNAYPACNQSTSKAVSFGIDTNFFVAIAVCVVILLILLLAVVVHRRKRDDLYKDMDDIRENIINYEDEGGGEVDTGYDLSVLRQIYDAPSIDSKLAPPSIHQKTLDEVPDICGFLDGRKESCDKDPDTNPFDDVRHYAYEGEGNSDGSLSSLASCTDDGDLKFNYLSNFGPRFRKLADMYGEEPSDAEDSDAVDERESESWC